MTRSSEQQGFVLWMTGLSGSGKTTIAKILEGELRSRSLKVERLDGDIVRQSLTKDLGFSKQDRDTNIARITFVAKLLSRNGVACICSFISPYQSIRDRVRVQTTNFLEVFIDADLETVVERDAKGLYKRALAGEIPNFTGISDPYEAPAEPDIHIKTDQTTPLECANKILEILEDRGLLPLTDLY
jgi:adenylyl-sulfate kinase